MTLPLWTFDEFLVAMKGRPIGVKPEVVAGISIDSRTIGPGEAFFAIEGERFNGHDFTTRALSGGAVTAVVAESRLSSMGRIKGSLTVVSDVLEALGDLGRAARARSDAKIVAVTGSVGKTGTKEMLAQALAADGSVHSSPASFNNHWGVPLSLSRLPVEARFAVFEIGMNHAGEIEPLVKMVRPHAAIVTTVESVHLEYFNDVKEIARAKGEIFSGLEPGGAAIINRDNPHYTLLAKMARKAGAERIIGFGANPKSDAWLEKIALKEDCSCISATILGEPVSYKLGMPGRHLVQNSLAVLAAVMVVGGDLAKAALSLATLVAPTGRGTRHRLQLGRDNEAVLIDDSYNANPASMRAAIALLGNMTPGHGGRRIAVLGDMRELGAQAPSLHADLADILAEAKIDRIFLTGPLMASLRDALPLHTLGGYAESTAELEPILFDAIAPGDVIMVKGSNASRMGALVETMKTRFVDRRAQTSHGKSQGLA
jgi:UDP-N-acetylmuramoyl-tripeptide--D-alanyl-D-alanine ligase